NLFYEQVKRPFAIRHRPALQGHRSNRAERSRPQSPEGHMSSCDRRPLLRFLFAVALLIPFVTLSVRGDRGRETPRLRVAPGQFITPFAARGATVEPLHTDLRADTNADGANAVSSAISPDGSTLLILTSGYNNSFFHEDGSPIVYPLLDP